MQPLKWFLIHSFDSDLLSIYCVSGTVLEPLLLRRRWHLRSRPLGSLPSGQGDWSTEGPFLRHAWGGGGTVAHGREVQQVLQELGLASAKD